MIEQIYVAERDGLIKIGWSNQVAIRIRSQKARLVWSTGDLMNAGGIEARVHMILARRRVVGKKEWYRISPALAVRAVQWAVGRSPSNPYRIALALGKSTIYSRIQGEWAPRLVGSAGK